MRVLAVGHLLASASLAHCLGSHACPSDCTTSPGQTLVSDGCVGFPWQRVSRL